MAQERKPHEKAGDLAPRADTATSSARKGPESGSLAFLQRAAGNRAVAQLVGNLHVQREMKVGDPPSTDVSTLQQQLNGAGTVPRLPVTGRFDAATETAVKAFQKAKGIAPESGIVDDTTKKALDKAAPVVSRGDQKTVIVGPGKSQVNLDPTGYEHVLVKRGQKGAKVKEVQERINGSPTMAEDQRKLRKNSLKDLLNVDGDFGGRTEAAVKQFQRDEKVKDDGQVGRTTWGLLLTKGGAATTGRTQFEWREEVEGVTNVGGTAKYEWKLTPDRLLISSGIKFIPKAKNTDARLNEWLQEIKDIWNVFQAVNKAKPEQKVNIDFEAVRGSDFNVNVHKATKDKKGNTVIGRSDAANWHIDDPRRGVASHEFGHLLGLADEYNREEGQYIATTGEEVATGDPTGDPVVATNLANAIKAEMPLKETGVKLAGKALAAAVAPLGRNQGGFSRFVAKRYKEINGTDIVTDIMAAFTAKGVDGFQANKSAAIRPFLYSSGSIMGTMTTASTTGTHDHPVEPRHLKPFVDIIVRERSMASKTAEEWEPKRR